MKVCKVCLAEHNEISNFCSQTCSDIWIAQLITKSITEAVFNSQPERK